MNLSYILVIIF